MPKHHFWMGFYKCYFLPNSRRIFYVDDYCTYSKSITFGKTNNINIFLQYVPEEDSNVKTMNEISSNADKLQTRLDEVQEELRGIEQVNDPFSELHVHNFPLFKIVCLQSTPVFSLQSTPVFSFRMEEGVRHFCSP